MTKEEVLEAVKGMSVLELADLVKLLEEEFGVSAAAPMAMAVGPAAGAAEAAPADEEEKTEFDVVIKEIGPNKINVIKGVREVTTLATRKESQGLVGWDAPQAYTGRDLQGDAEQGQRQRSWVPGAGAVVAVQ
ncbi:50S ribosomal protein L7/L12 [Geodia barretti]|uniref:50S ribosomal protein L7/L12 n=1 Tax=Geodia barretti TaxID=519541 RepID=A0AA35RRU9_GEOBA|nr:50S ribosomal protein L7/L12 [Geodia barretti]